MVMSLEPVISITIVLYNTSKFIGDCLDSIKECIDNGFAELIAIDNASPDDSAKIVREKIPNALIIQSDINKGFAGGCNLAWPYVKGKYWFLLNPDTVSSPDAIYDLVNWMEIHPEIGIGSPLLLQADGKAVYLSLAFPSVLRATLEATRLHKLLPLSIQGQILQIPALCKDNYLYVDWVPGTALLARRETVESAGLMSEKFFMYCEDVEWCWRVRQAGWKRAVYCGSKILHIGGGSSTSDPEGEKRAQRFAQNCYDADLQIIGKLRARIIVVIRVINYLIEYLHPLRSRYVKTISRAYLLQNLKVLVRKGQ